MLLHLELQALMGSCCTGPHLASLWVCTLASPPLLHLVHQGGNRSHWPRADMCTALPQRPQAGMKRWWTQLGSEPPAEDTPAVVDWQTCLDAHDQRILLSHLSALLAPGLPGQPAMLGTRHCIAALAGACTRPCLKHGHCPAHPARTCMAPQSAPRRAWPSLLNSLVKSWALCACTKDCAACCRRVLGSGAGAGLCMLAACRCACGWAMQPCRRLRLIADALPRCAGGSGSQISKGLAADLVLGQEADMPAHLVEAAQQLRSQQMVDSPEEAVPGMGPVHFPAEPLLQAASKATADVQVCFAKTPSSRSASGCV